MLRFGFVLVSGALLVTTAVAADPSAVPSTDASGSARLARIMDINHDGVISREEFRRHNADAARWRALDHNQDGVLDATEQAVGLRPGPRVIR